MARWSKELIRHVWGRRKRCFHCNTPLQLSGYGETWEVDHVIPRNDGGTNRRSNLVASCIHCNRSTQDNHGILMRLTGPWS